MKKKIIVPLMAIALICVSVINYSTIQSGKESGVTLRSLVKISSAESEIGVLCVACFNYVDYLCADCQLCNSCCDCMTCTTCLCHINHCTCDGSLQCEHGYSDNCPYCGWDDDNNDPENPGYCEHGTPLSETCNYCSYYCDFCGSMMDENGCPGCDF